MTTSGPNLHPNVLEVNDLRVHFDTDDGVIRAVDGVTFTVPRGKTVAVVGESGCGKSVTAYSLLRLIQKPGRIVDGRITLFPRDHAPIEVTSLPADADLLSHVRGGYASMVFQEPMTALSPVHTVGRQVIEALRLHRDLSKEAARGQAIAMLGQVGTPAPETCIDEYSFQLSGGMRQRVMIAMALICRPDLIIADEPTTALDVTIQAQILLLMKQLQQEVGCSLLLITHDLGVVAQMADQVAVMYLGHIVEQADIEAFYYMPRHPYSMDLMGSLPGRCYEGRLRTIRGSVPSMLEIPDGCPYHPRCMYAQAGKCDQGEPPTLQDLGDGRKVACVRATEVEMERHSLVFATMFGSDMAQR